MTIKEKLLRQYNQLINNDLPSLSKREGLVIRHNHCWVRLLLDNTFQTKWDRVLSRPAYKNLTATHLFLVIKLAELIIKYPTLTKDLNNRSLKYRNKL